MSKKIVLRKYQDNQVDKPRVLQCERRKSKNKINYSSIFKNVDVPMTKYNILYSDDPTERAMCLHNIIDYIL